jgi:hypothetical protein
MHVAYSSLVEQNDAIEVGIKESSVSTACPASWPSMKEYNSLSSRVAAFFPV